jgi:hypothetical protein
MHPIIALSVLEAVRACDLAKGDAPDAVYGVQEAIKLGRTTSVVAQIERYWSMVRRRETLAVGELAGLFTLVSRRPDADWVFAEAGRRAGRHAAQHAPRFLRIIHWGLPSRLRERLGRRLVRGAAAQVFGLDVGLEGGGAVALDGCGAHKVPDGRPCGVYGCGLAELSRIFTMFDGAYFRNACRVRGSASCRWSTNQQLED